MKGVGISLVKFKISAGHNLATVIPHSNVDARVKPWKRSKTAIMDTLSGRIEAIDSAMFTKSP